MNMNNKYRLNPLWVTGLIDAEGCFYVRFAKSNNYKTGWWVQPCFQLGFNTRDKELLLEVKSFFNNVGSIYPMNNNKSLLYQVRNLSDITGVIIPHFEKYPLISQKQSDFILFKRIVELMNKGEHFKKDSLIKIINLKASLNRGLSDKLKLSFPNRTLEERPIVFTPTEIDYNWIAGFFTGESCFSVTTNNRSLRVSIAQHTKDSVLMVNIKNTLKCGIVSKHYKEAVVLTVCKFKDIHNIIIPLLLEYNIRGIKALDFKDFCEIANLIDKKAHLTLDGLEKIREIKCNMNKSRIIS